MDSLQPIYNMIAKHLLAQGARSIDDVGKCVLWAPTGEACAVGAVLPRPKDEHAAVLLETKHEQWAELVAERFAVDCDDRLRLLLTEAQHIHDSREPEQWADELDLLAFDLGLDTLDDQGAP